MTVEELRAKGFVLQPDGSYAKPGFAADRLASGAQQQRDSTHDGVGENARESLDQVRRLVRVKSFRRKLCDERNLHEKVFVDSLTQAGILIDDSPQWAKIEVSQELVDDPAMERTEIEITALVNPPALGSFEG